MTQYISITLFALVAAGCSATTTQTQPQTPHQHNVVNTIRPGNAHGNSLVLPEPYRGYEPAAPPTKVASSSTNSDWVNDSMPFASQSDGTASSQWGVASDTVSAEQALGLQSSSRIKCSRRTTRRNQRNIR